MLAFIFCVRLIARIITSFYRDISGNDLAHLPDTSHLQQRILNTVNSWSFAHLLRKKTPKTKFLIYILSFWMALYISWYNFKKSIKCSRGLSSSHKVPCNSLYHLEWFNIPWIGSKYNFCREEKQDDYWGKEVQKKLYNHHTCLYSNVNYLLSIFNCCTNMCL